MRIFLPIKTFDPCPLFAARVTMPPKKRTIKRRSRVGRMPREVYCAAFKGTIIAGNSFNISPSSLGFKDSSIRLSRVEIEFAGCTPSTEGVAPCLVQADFYDGHTANSWLANITHLVVNRKKIVYRWPRRLDDIARSELDQNVVIIDCSCLSSNHSPVVAYFGRLWFSRPRDAVTITCLTDAFAAGCSIDESPSPSSSSSVVNIPSGCE